MLALTTSNAFHENVLAFCTGCIGKELGLLNPTLCQDMSLFDIPIMFVINVVLSRGLGNFYSITRLQIYASLNHSVHIHGDKKQGLCNYHHSSRYIATFLSF